MVTELRFGIELLEKNYYCIFYMLQTGSLMKNEVWSQVLKNLSLPQKHIAITSKSNKNSFQSSDCKLNQIFPYFNALMTWTVGNI